MKSKIRCRGFTLIELLVVIAIIALLVTLLVPALQEAKRQAKVVICITNVRTLALGYALYAEEEGDGSYPWSTAWDWPYAVTIWTSNSGSFARYRPNGPAYLDAYRDIICGGSFQAATCPISPPSGGRGADPNYPWLGYRNIQGYNSYYHGSYDVFANRHVSSGSYELSGNSETDGPPTKPGSSRDAIVNDQLWTSRLGGMYVDELYQGGHAFSSNGLLRTVEDVIKFRNENVVGYGDGHAEIHGEKAFLDSAGFISWPHAKYVKWGNGSESRITY